MSSVRPSCVNPNVPAHVILGAVPSVPPEARAQGLSGNVDVQVSLNEQSLITELKVISSASSYFMNTALAAARASKFAAEIKNCVPVASTYDFVVTLNPVHSVPPQISTYFIGTWNCTFSNGGQSVIAVGLNSGGAMVLFQGGLPRIGGLAKRAAFIPRHTT